MQILYEVLHVKSLSIYVKDDILYFGLKSVGSMCDVVNRAIKGFILNSTGSD